MLNFSKIGLKIDIPTDYILAYDFAGNLNDKSVNSNTCVNGGGVTFGVGKKGLSNECAVFNGSSNSYLQTAFAVGFGSDKITICANIFISGSATGTVLSNYSQGLQNYFRLGSSGLIPGDFFLQNSTDTTYQNLISTPLTYIGGWLNIIATIDRSQNGTTQSKIYINDILIHQTNYVLDNITGNFANNGIFFGRTNNINAPYFFVGKMQNLYIYNRILTSTEMTKLYNE